MKSLNATDSKKLLDEGWNYVDVRSPPEFADGHPKGAINVPLSPAWLQEMTARYKPDHKLLLGCAVGARSQRAAAALEQSGYSNVAHNVGGFVEWAALKLPSEK